MCEWLSCGAWCDVQLLCGGRSFRAHRAVLASVSSFLRRILLSSSSDETTTLIVLPDFDLEAMSSVLFYIYNGEVILQRNKLRLFLEIVQAMQIYIDYQYLSKIQEDVKYQYDFERYSETIPLNSEIFTLGFNNDVNQHIYNIKKLKESQGALLKYSPSDLDLEDNAVRCQNESELRESRLGNLKSPYEDRQRNSLLRDLYIETYPPNGNGNGLTESVLAISNECYLSPASVLLGNANRTHLNIDDTPTRHSKKAIGYSLHSLGVADEAGLQHVHSCNKECKEVSINNTVGSLLHKYSSNIANSAVDKSESCFEVNRFTPMDKKFDANTFSFNPMEYQVNNTIGHLTSDNAKFHSVHTKNDIRFKPSSRAIFNHVLESPWNARKPNNYRPFRRKEKYGDILPTYKYEKKEIDNDTNNNIQTLSTPEDITIEIKDVSEQELISGSSNAENRESFKCTHCDQVFTSGESLAVHMRRHSTNARYTCGECGKTFSQLRNFKYHMSIHRGTREFAATCTVCGKYFNDRGYLSSHMKIHKNRKEYKCTLCPKSFNQRVAYNMHVRIHTGVKPHVCDACGKAFSRKMLLKQHQRTHSGERPYACPHCDKRFADRSNMTLHLRLHTGVKPFSCPMCPKSFTKKHHLKSHLNFHTGSKPYSCPRCGLAFTQSSNMRTHYKKCNAPELSSTNTYDPQSNVPSATILNNDFLI